MRFAKRGVGYRLDVRRVRVIGALILSFALLVFLGGLWLQQTGSEEAPSYGWRFMFVAAVIALPGLLMLWMRKR